MFPRSLLATLVTQTFPEVSCWNWSLTDIQIWVNRERGAFSKSAYWFSAIMTDVTSNFGKHLSITMSCPPLQTLRFVLSSGASSLPQICWRGSTIQQSFLFPKVPLPQRIKITCYCCHCLVGGRSEERWEITVWFWICLSPCVYPNPYYSLALSLQLLIPVWSDKW